MMMNSSITATIAVVAELMLLFGRAGGATTTSPQMSEDPSRGPVASRTQIKWLINTGNLAGRRRLSQSDYQRGYTTVASCAQQSPLQCSTAVAAPNTVTRLQMIHGGNTAVLVMPTGDGGRRCCAGGVKSQFSLGSVHLDHGRNNLYPLVRPFPDWRAFARQPVVKESPKRKSDCEDEDDGCPENNPPATPRQDFMGFDRSTITPRNDNGSAASLENDHSAGGEKIVNAVDEKIVNAVDAFLDDRGRILWVLDMGGAGEDACLGNTAPPVDGRISRDPNEGLPPKFLAIDVLTNQIISVVSLSRVWKPGISCFQYIVAIYSDTEVGGHGSVNNTTRGGSTNTTVGCADWPLVVIGDAGTNHLQVYSHGRDKFTEIMLPFEEESVADEDDDEDDGGGSGNGGKTKSANGAGGESTPRSHKKKLWPATPIRDILYVAPLYPRPGHSCLLITYHGCRDVYNLRLQPSTTTEDDDSANATAAADDDDNNSDGVVTPASPAPVTGTLTVIGRKPCRMIVLGTDRRRTDVTGGDEGFAGGGTTVYFRLENTNDIWSWNTADKRKYTEGTGSFLSIDQRHFRLVRPGQTCRVPIAVSVAPAAVAANKSKDGDNDDGKQRSTITEAPRVVRQIVWMLETNFIDHFQGTVDRLGANAKLQPIEEPLYNSVYNDMEVAEDSAGDPKKKSSPPPLPVQPAVERRINAGSRTRCFHRDQITKINR